MLILIFKYSTVYLLSLFNFNKLLKIKTNKIQLGLHIATLPIFLILKDITNEFSTLLLLVLITSINFISTKVNYNVIITSSTLSIAISFALFYVSSIIFTPVQFLLINLFENQTSDNIANICIIPIVLIATLMNIGLYKIKRLKSGMPFIYKSEYHPLFSIYSIAILLAVSLINANFKYQNIYLILLGVIIIVYTLIYVYWKTILKISYREKLYENDIQDKLNIISKLQDDNDNMSKIIHNDNKLLKAILENDKTNSNEAINIMLNERLDYELDYKIAKSFKHTGVFVLDNLIKYYMKLSSENNIDFECNISETLPDINEYDFTILVSELLSNSVYSVINSENKTRILKLEINSENNELSSITIYDSGDNFPLNIIHDIGKARITSHKDDGGSGIGFMSIIEIIKKHKATCIINSKGLGQDTKSIQIIFNENFNIIHNTETKSEIVLK